MIPKRTQHYTELVFQGLRRGWSVAKISAMGKAGLINIGDAPDPEFPAKPTVFDWLGTDSQFAEQYLAARRAGCEAMVDDGIVIVDDQSEDTEWCVSEKTGELVKIIDHEHVQRSRLRADYRKWYVAKLVPRLYGERVEIEHKGNVELVSRLTAGRQRALGEAQPALTDQRMDERSVGATYEGSAVRVVDDGSELV